MPQLGDDSPAGAAHGLDYRLPSFDLVLVPQARRMRPAEPFSADPGRFADKKSGLGALGLIFGHDRGRHRFPGRSGAGQRGH
jgi:hypothetical protein